MSKSDDQRRNTFRENAIDVGAGFLAKERPHVLEALSTLAPHLGRRDPGDVDIDDSLRATNGEDGSVPGGAEGSPQTPTRPSR
jgi:hypothetical protein